MCECNSTNSENLWNYNILKFEFFSVIKILFTREKWVILLLFVGKKRRFLLSFSPFSLWRDNSLWKDMAHVCVYSSDALYSLIALKEVWAAICQSESSGKGLDIILTAMTYEARSTRRNVLYDLPLPRREEISRAWNQLPSFPFSLSSVFTPTKPLPNWILSLPWSVA